MRCEDCHFHRGEHHVRSPARQGSRGGNVVSPRDGLGLKDRPVSEAENQHSNFYSKTAQVNSGREVPEVTRAVSAVQPEVRVCMQMCLSSSFGTESVVNQS